MSEWISDNIIEIFGAVTGILYVFLEIRQNILLWPLGILTSAVYMYVFRDNGFYAGMVLQGYYLVISIYGWWEWRKAVPGKGQVTGSKGNVVSVADDPKTPGIRRLDKKAALTCLAFTLILWALLWYSLDRWTDSPVPLWDSIITSLSVVATWMLTHKILEQWHVWIIANSIAAIVYLSTGMYPTAVLFIVYLVMAVVGLREWRKDLRQNYRSYQG